MAIYGLTYENVFLIIDTQSIPKCNVKDIFIIDNHLIDFANEEDIIDKIMDFPFHIEKDSVLEIVQNNLNMQKLDFGNRLIVELFSKKI